MIARTHGDSMKRNMCFLVRAIIVILVFVDIIAISFEISIAQNLFGKVEREEASCPASRFNCSLPEHDRPEEVAPVMTTIVNHKLKKIEEGLHRLSIALLSVFLLEIIISILAIGPRWFCNVLHVFDMAVVLTAFFIEILVARDAVVGVIVALRLVRIIQGVVDSEREAHERTVLSFHRAANLAIYQRRLLREALSSRGLSDESVERAKFLLRPARTFRRKEYKDTFEIERESGSASYPESSDS
eukprot:c14403_g2_i1.p1 GENE.c14403_g2_i1~~c14403_g2_i1.p1  ORF type:complete len:244 (-),score=38.76 c14403_g2_i1:60-791(-)